MEDEWVKKWVVRVSLMYLSNGYITEWFDLMECKVCNYGGDDDPIQLEKIVEVEKIAEGSMYKGKVVDYQEFSEMIGKVEIINTTSEDDHILDSLDSGREKFNELIKNTWSKDDSENLKQLIRQEQERELQKMISFESKKKKNIFSNFNIK